MPDMDEIELQPNPDELEVQPDPGKNQTIGEKVTAILTCIITEKPPVFQLRDYTTRLRSLILLNILATGREGNVNKIRAVSAAFNSTGDPEQILNLLLAGEVVVDEKPSVKAFEGFLTVLTDIYDAPRGADPQGSRQQYAYALCGFVGFLFVAGHIDANKTESFAKLCKNFLDSQYAGIHHYAPLCELLHTEIVLTLFELGK